MPNIELRFNQDIIIVDGAMGTMLQQQEIPADECGMMLNLLDPELIVNIHERYKLAGAQAITTNSFGGTRAKLAYYGLGDRVDELNRAAVRLAKAAQPEHVLADVGPCGLVLEPLGNASFDEVFEQYAEQVQALTAEGPDAILIETMSDIADARCALLAARSACDLPVLVCCTFDATGHMELSGTTPEAAAVILEAAGAAAVGMNCGLGPGQLLPLIERMGRATSLPLIVQPNAGLPEVDASGATRYIGTADDFAIAAEAFRNAGVQLIGSCCGSTPAFTGAIYATVGGLACRRRAENIYSHTTTLASPAAVVALGGGQPTRIIGERINPTGKPDLAAELEQGLMSIVKQFAESQERAGAELIDVNVGAPMVDAKTALPAVVGALQGFIHSPLVLDTTDYEALERALRLYPGKALINSVNGEAASMERVLPLAKEYGAALIALTLDENGIPKTWQGRMEIAERIRKAANAHGILDRDLVFDVLTMAAASDASAPETTLNGVRAISGLGISTVLGVSNVSHGLPDRPALNAAFVSAAIAAGLSAAIANPEDPVMSESVRLANAQGGVGDFDAALEQWRTAFKQVMERASGDPLEGSDGGAAGSKRAAKAGLDAAPLPATEMLKRTVLRGDKHAAPALVDAVIAEGMAADTIVELLLTPTLRELGEAFARGEAFLPQMMLSAGAMKVAVARIKEHLPTTGEDEAAGKVVFCTVKGDVHSIGKDICIALLESQGFKVFDLGVDVAAEDVVATALREDADVICLSALMTTTLPNMKETVERVYAELPQFASQSHKAVAVGGAVVSERWADSVHAAYRPDAATLVEFVQSVVANKHL